MPWRVKTTAVSVFTALRTEDLDALDKLFDEGKVFAALHNGSFQRIRPNGGMQRWKRDAKRFRKPFKLGMYGYGAADNGHVIENAQRERFLSPALFRHIDDLTEDKR